jgi:capsular polysaccharide biosynthesis protein
LERTVDFAKIIHAVIKRIWLIALVTVLIGLAGVIYTWEDIPNEYGAETSIYSVASGSYAASMQSTSIMKDYAEIIGSKKVADRVVTALPDYNLDAKRVQTMVKTSFSEDSAIFYVYAYSNDPALVISVANSAAEAFVLEVSNITGADNVKILDEADSIFVSYDGQKEQLKTRIIFAAAGFALSCGILVLAAIFGTRVTKVEDCTLNGEIKLLGVIPKHSI